MHIHRNKADYTELTDITKEFLERNERKFVSNTLIENFHPIFTMTLLTKN